jgi:hypothetical protein
MIPASEGSMPPQLCTRRSIAAFARQRCPTALHEAQALRRGGWSQANRKQLQGHTRTSRSAGCGWRPEEEKEEEEEELHDKDGFASQAPVEGLYCLPARVGPERPT